MGGLQNLFNWAIPTGEAGYTAGQGDVGTAAGYWRNILSGNRSAIEAAVAPERNAALSSADAAKRTQAAFGTARGGGVAGANRTLGDTTRATIDNAILSMRPMAAKGLEQAGGTELQSALDALGLGTRAESAVGDIANQQPATAGLAQAEGGLIGTLLGGLFGL